MLDVGRGGNQIWTMTQGGGGEGVKKFNILLDILCEWPLRYILVFPNGICIYKLLCYKEKQYSICTIVCLTN